MGNATLFWSCSTVRVSLAASMMPRIATAEDRRVTRANTTTITMILARKPAFSYTRATRPERRLPALARATFAMAGMCPPLYPDADKFGREWTDMRVLREGD